MFLLNEQCDTPWSPASRDRLFQEGMIVIQFMFVTIIRKSPLIYEYFKGVFIRKQNDIPEDY